MARRMAATFMVNEYYQPSVACMRTVEGGLRHTDINGFLGPSSCPWRAVMRWTCRFHRVDKHLLVFPERDSSHRQVINIT